jgi:bacillithiol biosynthesis deacetylase BshB1
MKLDALFFAAHPDDVELSCGGTVIALVESGKKVGIVDLTGGELGTRGSAKIRQEETRKATNILRVQVRMNLKIADGNIGITNRNKLKIISTIRKFQPKVVFAPYRQDRHPDHFHASQLVEESAFYSGLQKIKSLDNGKMQRAFRPEKIIFYMQTYTFPPSFIIDISKQFKKKMEAIRCYSSQFYDPESNEPETFISDKKFLEYIESRARFYGFAIGKKYGEPFYVETALEVFPENLF